MNLNLNIQKSFKHSLLFKYLNYILILISGFILIPFYLKNFSLELFGAWIIVSAFTTALMMFDPGSTNLLIQQISKKIGKKNKKNLNGIILSGLINSLIIASIIFLVGMIFGTLLIFWVIESASIADEIKTAFKYAIFAVTITLLAMTLYGIMEGFQKTFISGLIVFSSSLIKIISVVLLIKLNFGIKSLPLGDLIASTFLLVLFSLYIAINFNFFIKKLNLKFDEYKKYTSLFLYNYSGRFTKILTSGGIDNIIIAKLIGLENVTTYYLAQVIPKKLESFIGVTLISARPGLAYLSGNLSKYNFVKLKLKLIYLILLIFIFLIYFLYDIIDPFLKLWIGKDVYPGFYIVFLIIILNSQRILTNAFSIILFSAGKIKEISKLQIVYSLILIPFLILGVKFYSLSGLLIAHIIILFFTLTVFLSIMMFKDLHFLKSYKIILIKEILFLILATIASLFIYKITLQFLNIQTINWLIFIFILLIKVAVFTCILSSLSKHFRNEFLYFLKKREFMPLSKWKV